MNHAADLDRPVNDPAFERPAAMEETTAEGMLGNDDTINSTNGSGCAQAVALRTEKDHGSESAVQNGSIDVTLENESVWSRFHSLGTEMILTEQGRRMFPCCRFRLSGLDPHLRYFLIMDFTPLDDFRHRWNGKTWERDGTAEPHPRSPECFHPDSPALGQHWMDGPVSFYKVKLTHSSLERDAGVLLYPMCRYQPRLFVVPVSVCPERSVPLEGPGVHMFTFPLTEFYAVTSYQNPQITRLKIDCNPFMLAFREDGPSARLIQNKLGLALTGRSPSRPSVANHTGNNGKVSAGDQHLSSTHAHQESCEGGGIRSNDSEGERLIRPRDEPAASLDSESAEDVMTDPARPQISRPLGVTSRRKPAVPSTGPALSGTCNAKRVYRRRMKGAWKAKAKWWSNVKYARAAAARVNKAMDVSMQPDLEDVDGVLFVSFTAKEALDVHVGNMRKSVQSSPSSHTQNQTEKSLPDKGLSVSDDGSSAADRISEHELVLLQRLKQLKNRQILHPALQQVGLKLNLVDPAAPIDLHYLGVDLPSPVLDLTPSSHAPFVSRTGKTNDLTRIKGWMEKFSSKSAADSNHSAFSSDLLDEYLESEGQQISDRAAVFSTSSPSPVVYQLPVKSSSYVRTLDSVLQTRGVTPNVCSSRPPGNIVRSSSRSTSQRSLQDHHPKVSHDRTRIGYSRRGRKCRRRRQQLRFNREAVDGSQSSASAKSLTELLAQEEHAIFHGRSPAYITTERASFALSSLLTTETAVKTTQFSTRHVNEEACVKDFCRLGCVCHSLNREIRGSTHCRRVQCMFSCGCFKHKILLIRSPELSRTHSTSSLMAFPIADQGSDSRPAPALRVTSLWKRRPNEDDPEPIFTPKAVGVPRRAPRLHTYTPRPNPQVQEKDPVYLFLESMMTCARVREYNSDPPPQVHLLPPKRPDEMVNDASQSHLTSPGVTAGEPEPTKVLEIISRCNWESHRSLVLKELFRCINMNCLSSLFSVDIYKVELLSKNLKTDGSSSMLTYKVCVSLAEKPEKTREPKKREDALRNSSSQKVNKLNDERVNDTIEAEHFPLLSHVVPAGYLKADKKTLMDSGPIKVNGKTYTQAKLLLGRMGSLHPANRLAAYVTGRIKPAPQNASHGRSVSKTPQVRTTPARDPSKRTARQANQSKAAFKAPAPQTLAIFKAPDGVKSTPTLFIFSHVPNPAAAPPNPTSTSNHMTSSKPGRELNAVAPPLSGAAPLSKGETVLPASALPPGQQVVLQPVAGMTGVNMCQFNGQMIQLVPVPAAPPVNHQSSAGSAQQEAQTATQLPQMTKSILNPAPFPFIAPRIHPVPGNGSFTIGSGVQNGFLAKNNTFSFRICPPAAEGKTTGLEQTQSGESPSTLLLPGGYRLIKLPMLVQPSVNPESSPSGSHVMTEKSSASSEGNRTSCTAEDPTGLQSAASIKTEPSETPTDAPPVDIKVEPYSDSLQTDKHHDTSEHPCSEYVKIVKIEEPSEMNQPDDNQNKDSPRCVTVKIEEPDSETDIRHCIKASESSGPKSSSISDALTEAQQHLKTNTIGDFSRPLFVSPISAFSKLTFAVPLLPAQTKTPEEPREHACAAPADGGGSLSRRANRRPREFQNRIQWLWKRKRQALTSDAPPAGSDRELAAGVDDSSAALMYSSDGWSTEDSNEKSGEDDVDIETFQAEDERKICRLRAKARRKTQQAASHHWLAKPVGKAAHHAVRLMSDLPLYKRTWRLNQALRGRKRQVELQRSLDSLRRTLCVEEHVRMSTEDLLRQARQVITALEDRSRSLMAQKRALIQQHSHFQTVMSQRSAAGTESHVEQKAAAAETPRHERPVLKRASRLPNIVLQSFTGI
ncbi:MAX gene-associated protein [Megalobrama amblycephala]|uniref:MAX gene-associated protein n=1 Tax=Megalobrama amblycephala TaxID=75352 RepID=UPI002014136E|nr:MAX gene-associated protein [Megalobrama amblycephala]